MKTKTYFIVITLFLFSNAIDAQSEQKASTVFLRIYDSNKIKINKGKLVSIDVRSIDIRRNKKIVTININEIGTIKTKRAIGNNLGIGAAVGTTIGAIVGFAQGEDAFFGANSAGDGALAFATLGLISGTVVGGLTALGKNPEKFEINQNPERLMRFKEFIYGENKIE